MDKTEISPQLDYSKTDYVHSSLDHQRIYPELGASSIVLSATTSTDSQFLIPEVCYNSAESVVNFDIRLEGAAGVNMFTSNIPFWQTVQLKTRTGTMLCDLQNEDFKSEILNRFFKWSDILYNGDIVSGLVLFGTSANPIELNGLGSYFNGPFSEDAVTLKKYAFATTGNTATDVTIKVRLPMRFFAHSLLGVDKSLYFGQPLVLFFRWNPHPGIGFSQTTTGTSPNLAYSPLTACTISNFYINLAVEQRIDITSELINKINGEGLNLLFDYPIVKTYTLTGDQQDVQARLSGAYGSRLKRIYHAMFYQNAALPQLYNHAYLYYNPSTTIAVLRNTITSMYSTMDSKRLHANDFVIANKDVYRYMRPLLAESGYTRISEFEQNAVFCDWWDSGSFMDKSNNVVEGLDISGREITYGLSVNMTNVVGVAPNLQNINLTHVLVAVMQRSLTIRKNEVIII